MSSPLRALALALALALPSLAEAGSRKLDRKAARAAEAADHGDLAKAVDLGLQVLEVDPGNVDAAWAVGVAMSALLRSGAVASEDEQEIRAGTLALLTVAGEDPLHPVRAATARRLLSELQGDRVLLPRLEPTCPAEAAAAFTAAEDDFGARRMSEARAHYEDALRLCPTNATWIVYLGDTWLDEDRAQALAAYDRALSLEPCHPQAHRFAADVRMEPEDEHEVALGYTHALNAVACDPTYEEAWVTLGGYLRARGQRTLPRWEARADVQGWERYQEALKATPGDDPLARREAAIRAVLREGPPDTPLWAGIMDASGRGFLVEAILFELLDEELVPVYLAERSARQDRLRAYVEGFHTASAGR